MGAWESRKLSEVCQIRPPKKEAISKLKPDEEVSFVPMNDLGVGTKYFEATQTKALKEVSGSYTYFTDGDVLLAKITPCFENGKLGIASDLTNGIGFGSSEFIVYRPSEELLPEFLYYYLNQPQFREKGALVMRGAVGHKRVPLDYYQGTEIPLPPLPEQKRIVAILDQAFEAIDQAEANIERNIGNVEEMQESIFQLAFADNLEGDNGVTLSELCELIVDCEHKTAPCQDTGYPSIRTPNIGFGKLILHGVNRVSEEVYRKWTRRAIPLPGDLILAREAPAGNIGIIPEDTYVCLGQRTVLLRTKSNLIAPLYLAYLILSKDVQAKLLSHSQGSTVTHINLRDIRGFEVFNIPDLDTQQKKVDYLSQVVRTSDALKNMYHSRQSRLDELRKSMLGKAFVGELAQKEVAL